MADWRAFGRQSLGFMSRRPVASTPGSGRGISRHAFLEVVPEGETLRVFGVHLSAVHAAWTEQRRVLELRAMLRSVARHQHGFHVLAGDFNTIAPGESLDVTALPLRLQPLVWMSGGRITWRDGADRARRRLCGRVPSHPSRRARPHAADDWPARPARLCVRSGHAGRSSLRLRRAARPQATAASDHFLCSRRPSPGGIAAPLIRDCTRALATRKLGPSGSARPGAAMAFASRPCRSPTGPDTVLSASMRASRSSLAAIDRAG